MLTRIRTCFCDPFFLVPCTGRTAEGCGALPLPPLPAYHLPTEERDAEELGRLGVLVCVGEGPVLGRVYRHRENRESTWSRGDRPIMLEGPCAQHPDKGCREDPAVATRKYRILHADQLQPLP